MPRAPSRRVGIVLALAVGFAGLWLGAESLARPAEPAPLAAAAFGSVHIGVDAAALRARPDGPVERILIGRSAKQKSALGAGVIASVALVALVALGWVALRARSVAVQPALARRAPARAPPLSSLLLA